MEHGVDCTWKHAECEACPVEVRVLFAAAFNACKSFEHSKRGGENPECLARKMAELRQACTAFQPFIDKHFKDV
jgi:hypothetical protein